MNIFIYFFFMNYVIISIDDYLPVESTKCQLTWSISEYEMITIFF